MATVPGINGVIAGIDGSSQGVVLLNLEDGTKTTLLKGGSEEDGPAWSPTGDRLAVTSGGDLVALNADGTDKQTLVADACGGTNATWSPDGSQIAYHRCTDIAIINSDGTNATAVPGTSSFSIGEWSPDGQWLAGSRLTDGQYDVWKIRPDGTNLTQITSLPGDQGAASWSPDGTKIAFVDFTTENWDIYVVGAEGGAATNLTQSSGKDFSPKWSPDGTRILFGSTRGDGGLFTMAADGSDVAAVPNGDRISAGAWQPAQITVSPSRTVVQAGASVDVNVRVASPGTENPVVTVQRRTASTPWTDWQAAEVDVSGVASLTATVKENTWFRAVWSGDSTHLGGTSIPTQVGARVTVTGHLFRFYRVQSGWHLYHVGRRIWYTGQIEPSHAGQKMCFEGEHLRGGAWRRVFSDCYKISKDGTTTIVVYNVPLGERARLRAVFRNDADHMGDEAPWSRLRVTA
jgi:dipeptidyl aminopeptidase/acylaminoacyl peptidase